MGSHKISPYLTLGKCEAAAYMLVLNRVYANAVLSIGSSGSQHEKNMARTLVNGISQDLPRLYSRRGHASWIAVHLQSKESRMREAET